LLRIPDAQSVESRVAPVAAAMKVSRSNSQFNQGENNRETFAARARNRRTDP